MLDAESKSTEAIDGVPEDEDEDDALDADLLSKMEDMAIGNNGGNTVSFIHI